MARREVFVTLCLAAALAIPRIAWAHPLEVVPADDPVYEDLYRLASRGLVPLWAASTRPLTRLDLARVLARGLDRVAAVPNGFSIADLGDLERLVLQFSDELFLLGYRVVEPPHGPSAMAITGWGTQLERAIVTRIESGSPPWYEPTTGGGARWSSRQLDISEVLGLGASTAMGIRVRPQLLPTLQATTGLERLYLSLTSSLAGQDVSVRLGRDFLWWGPGWRGAFLLSDHAGALDYLAVSLEWERLRVLKLLVPLDLGIGRFLYGLRFDWLATDTLRLGFGDAMVASEGIYLPYLLNPLPLVADYISLHSGRQGPLINDNYDLSLDADWQLGRGVILYGEFYADDITTAENPFPSRLGRTLGLFLDRIAGSKTTLRLEHSRALNWIYATGGVNDYIRNGRALGHWCAPDCELWSAELARPLESGSAWKFGYEVVRKGQGQLGQTWSGPAEAWAKLYLSGVIETTQSWRLSYEWTAAPSLRHKLGAIWSSVDNASHAVGQTRQDWFVWWEARYEF